ncbi:glycosyltransferase family 2 protein [Pseudomonas saliphila]|uniref:glycosyltransferase family 2 protein n=1 Tax=Pseudomonas saliphila TaxID=2586906 RepID=UPI00123921D8|nr:glycosyltransferase family 2 protein [Pseudomonas saliphila]
MTDGRICILIPVYNHPDSITAVCASVAPFRLPVLLVDDGSDARCAGVLDGLAAQGHLLLRLSHNQGKGAAVRAGLQHAEQLGFTHALQIDADGQHAVADLPGFLAAAEHTPQALTIGYPRYDASVSRSRFYGRYATHIWVWINTLSLDIRDSMCGARLYPLREVNALLNRHACGDRMAFDTEILVRWHWAGGQLRNLPVRVHYPTDGVSHFRLLRDNLQISGMHTRLFFGMLLRLPRLLAARLRRRSMEAAG